MGEEAWFHPRVGFIFTGVLRVWPRSEAPPFDWTKQDPDLWHWGKPDLRWWIDQRRKEGSPDSGLTRPDPAHSMAL